MTLDQIGRRIEETDRVAERPHHQPGGKSEDADASRDQDEAALLAGHVRSLILRRLRSRGALPRGVSGATSTLLVRAGRGHARIAKEPRAPFGRRAGTDPVLVVPPTIQHAGRAAATRERPAATLCAA